MKFTYTYTDTKVLETGSFLLTEGSQLLRRPLHKFGFEVAYLLPDDGGEISLSGRYVGKRDDVDPNTFANVSADDYFVVGLAGRYRISPNFNLIVRVENVFDDDYEDVLGFETARLSAYGGITIEY